MSDVRLENTLKHHRDKLGLSQQALAELVGVSRQAVSAIESGRQVPSTSLALQLARGLGCGVEDLFRLEAEGTLLARLAAPAVEGAGSSVRVALGSVDGAWVAHRLALDAEVMADGVLAAPIPPGQGGPTGVRPLDDPDRLRRNVLVAGCAPLLGAVAQRVAGRFSDARVRWLQASSHHALDLLRDGLVHVAGVHLSGHDPGGRHEAVVRAAFPDRTMLIVNLTRWRQGMVLPPGNPLGLTAPADLARPGLRVARRDPGAGAHELLARALPPGTTLEGPRAAGHEEVAHLVRCGAADVGVAIEGVAAATGLDFVPLSEERFDLVVPGDWAAALPVSRLLDTLDDAGFRADAASLPGYDPTLGGHVTTVEPPPEAR